MKQGTKVHLFVCCDIMFLIYLSLHLERQIWMKCLLFHSSTRCVLFPRLNSCCCVRWMTVILHRRTNCTASARLTVQCSVMCASINLLILWCWNPTDGQSFCVKFVWKLNSIHHMFACSRVHHMMRNYIPSSRNCAFQIIWNQDGQKYRVMN